MSQSAIIEPQPPPSAQDEDKLYEIIDGEYRELQPMGTYEATLATELARYLREFAHQHNLGTVISEGLFVLNSERNLQRRPDVAFVSYDRWPEPEIPRTNAWNVVPDLAVEVVSPTNTAEEIDTRVTDYLTAGVRLLWVIYPETGHVYVFKSLKSCHVLERSEELDGGEVLRGFRLPIERLFEATRKPD